MSTETAEIVADPVSHISISGVHGRDELNRRLAQAPRYRNGNDPSLTTLVVGAAVGALMVALLKR